MFKNEILLTLVCICCFLVSKAQSDIKETIVTMQMEARHPHRPFFNKVDTFFVRNDFILEPIRIIYSNGETNLGTNVTRNHSAGKRLQYYNLTNYREMVGMSFDLEKKATAKTIETYKVSNDSKLGIRFFNEPFLMNGLSVTDLTKDKDTIINGTKCFLVKNSKVVTAMVNKRAAEKILQVQIAINPSLRSYDFPFISEKIVKEFGGGAIVYVVFLAENGSTTTVRYNYSPFTAVETSLFDHYQMMYNLNLPLLDKFKKKK